MSKPNIILVPHNWVAEIRESYPNWGKGRTVWTQDGLLIDRDFITAIADSSFGDPEYEWDSYADGVDTLYDMNILEVE
jgi:hypothetical protein